MLSLPFFAALGSPFYWHGLKPRPEFFFLFFFIFSGKHTRDFHIGVHIQAVPKKSICISKLSMIFGHFSSLYLIKLYVSRIRKQFVLYLTHSTVGQFSLVFVFLVFELPRLDNRTFS